MKASGHTELGSESIAATNTGAGTGTASGAAGVIASLTGCIADELGAVDRVFGERFEFRGNLVAQKLIHRRIQEFKVFVMV